MCSVNCVEINWLDYGTLACVGCRLPHLLHLPAGAVCYKEGVTHREIYTVPPRTQPHTHKSPDRQVVVASAVKRT